MKIRKIGSTLLITVLTATLLCPSVLFAALITQNESREFRYFEQKDFYSKNHKFVDQLMPKTTYRTAPFNGFDTSLGILDNAWIEFEIHFDYQKITTCVYDNDWSSYAYGETYVFSPGHRVSLENMIISDFYQPPDPAIYIYGDGKDGPNFMRGSDAWYTVSRSNDRRGPTTTVPFLSKDWATMRDTFELNVDIWDPYSSVSAPEDDDYIAMTRYDIYGRLEYSVHYEYTPHPEPSPVPVPATLLLLGMGICGLAGLRRT